VKFFAVLAILVSFLLPQSAVAAEPITRAEAFDLVWQPLKRMTEKTNEAPFIDVSERHPLHELITYAKARGIVEDGEYFYPAKPVRLKDALLWLLRSRNVRKWSQLSPQTVPAHALRYGLLQALAGTRDRRTLRALLTENAALTQDELTVLRESLDSALTREQHTVSYYGNYFAGRRTAFGEVFDPGTMTAAHRTLPHNTLLRVTNTENGKSVVVRINDRGPYVSERGLDRDLDLSRAAFEHLASISRGILSGITFERLGSSKLIEHKQKVKNAWHQRHANRRRMRLAARR